LSHRAYKTSRAFQLVLAVLGTASMQNGPLWWASWHRRHHKDADTLQDPHSPAHVGFLRAHLGWVLERPAQRPDFSNIKDLVRIPELRFLERHKWLPLIAWAVAKKIAERGIEPRRFMAKAWARLPPVLAQEIRRALEEVAAGA
jgi:stearoyl-CoA desaturase (delta-9 desaturase)